MLRVHVLGELELDLDGAALEPPPSRRARALLGFMALHPGPHPRSVLAARFWPDVLDESARTSLRGALTAVRRSLGPAAERHLVATRETAGLTDVWTDAAEFAALIAAGRDEDALTLCRGDLLAGLDDDWVLAARDEHRDAQTAALARLADAAGDADVALRHVRARIALDPLSEEAHRDLMTRLAAAGDRAAALAAYNRLADRLRTELRIAPSAATRELAESLRNGEVAAGDDRRAARGRVGIGFPRALDPRRARSPFVGRDLERLRAAVALERPLVAISGDPGIGKTRLLGELARGEHADGATVLYGRCPEEPVAPYQPFAEALRPLPGSPFGEAAAGDAAGARLRLFDAVAATLAEAPGRVLLALDDLHWADKPSVLLLAHLLRDPPPSLVIAATYREVELGRGHPLAHALADLRRDRLVERFALGGLDGAAAAGLIEGWVGADATAGLVTAVLDETGGNPFFIEEVLRHLLESGALGVEDGRWHLTRPVRDLGVPESVREVIGRRLDRLGDAAVEVLQTAAIVGAEFELAVLERASPPARDEVLDALERAADANLIRTVADRSAAWSFTHALIREALHDELSGLRRMRLHARVAEALAELGADPGRLARHGLEAAALVGEGRAADWAQAAGDAALAALAYEDAAEHYRDALEVVPNDPARRSDLALALADALVRAGDPAAREACDAAIAAARELGDGERLARAALVACGLGVTIIGLDHERIALLEEALRGATGALRARVLARLAIALYYAPGGGRADELSAEAVAVAREAGDPDALLAALNARHVGLWNPAGLEERFRVADEMIALAREHGRREAELQGRNWRCVDLWEAGDHEGFDRERAEHERLADELRLPAFRWYATMWRAAVAARAGRREEAMELAEAAAREATRAGDPNGELFRVMLRIQAQIHAGEFTDELIAAAEERQGDYAAWIAWAPGLCWAYLERGRIEEGRQLFERLIRDDFASLDQNANWYVVLYDFAQIMALLGEPDAAERLYERLLPYAGRRVVAGRAIYDQGSVHYPLARFAALAGRPEVAARHFEAALAAEEAVGARPNLILVRARYAQLLAEQGDHERARELVVAAIREADELGTPGAVPAEAAALATAGAPR